MIMEPLNLQTAWRKFKKKKNASNYKQREIKLRSCGIAGDQAEGGGGCQTVMLQHTHTHSEGILAAEA